MVANPPRDIRRPECLASDHILLSAQSPHAPQHRLLAWNPAARPQANAMAVPCEERLLPSDWQALRELAVENGPMTEGGPHI